MAQIENGKLENQLLLALSSSQGERERSDNLDIGYREETSTWEVIVRYQGNLAQVTSQIEGIDAIELLNGYAVVTVREDQIELLSGLDEVEFIEKPKRLYFEVYNGKSASCILPLQQSENNGLTGEGIIMAVIDSGIDYSHPDFRREDGSTRLIGLWDQSSVDASIPPPSGYRIGSFYSEERINEALFVSGAAERFSLVPSIDISGHGTAVAGIACGNGTASGGQFRGVAYQSEILAVKLGGVSEASAVQGGALTTRLMMAVDFCLREALRLQQPIVINLSFGNNNGAHNGNSLVERYLNSAADVWKSVIVTGTGNEGSAGHHYEGSFSKTTPAGAISQQVVEWAVSPGETSLSIQLWKSYSDEFELLLTSPSRETYGPIPNRAGAQRFQMDNTEVLLLYGEPKPYEAAQEVYFDFLPAAINPEGLVLPTLTEGIWSLTIRPIQIVDGSFRIWMPTSSAIGSQTRFLRPSINTTLTIPSTVSNGISVGAYDAANNTIAFFSGRGYPVGGNPIKPELVAPGVGIYTTAVGGGYGQRTGTSFAAPFVSGSCALLMEWGIVRGNDPYLYGEKVKAYLIKGARRLPGYDEWPNRQAGWGAMCVRDSLD